MDVRRAGQTAKSIGRRVLGMPMPQLNSSRVQIFPPTVLLEAIMESSGRTANRHCCSMPGRRHCLSKHAVFLGVVVAGSMVLLEQRNLSCANER